MVSYRIVIKKSAAKEIEKIQKKDRVRIIEKIRCLASDPQPAGSKKLSGQEKYRIRQGNYRILYQIIDHELIISDFKIRHRRAIYKHS
jgi:mRNA interferase RelE/StbE